MVAGHPASAQSQSKTMTAAVTLSEEPHARAAAATARAAACARDAPLLVNSLAFGGGWGGLGLVWVGWGGGLDGSAACGGRLLPSSLRPLNPYPFQPPPPQQPHPRERVQRHPQGVVVRQHVRDAVGGRQQEGVARREGDGAHRGLGGDERVGVLERKVAQRAGGWVVGWGGGVGAGWFSLRCWTEAAA
jgi:hypothetical protein